MITHYTSCQQCQTVSNSVNSVNSVDSVNSYSAVLPPSPMVFFSLVVGQSFGGRMIVEIFQQVRYQLFEESQHTIDTVLQRRSLTRHLFQLHTATLLHAF